MARTLSAILAAAWLLSASSWSQAQGPPPPPPAFTDGPGGAPPSPLLSAPVQVPGTGFPTPVPNSPPPPPLYQNLPPPGVTPGPTIQPPGWFGAIELSLVSPGLHYHLSAPVTVAGVTTRVDVPGATLDWTGSPRLEIGYRFAEGLGGIIATYQSVVSQGGETLSNFDAAGDGFAHTRLNMNVVDLDYLSTNLQLAPFWDLRWRAGLRFAAIYADSRAAGAILEERSSNNFIGGGPHGGIEIARALDAVPGLEVFGRLDGAVVIGEITQSYEATLVQPDNSLLGGASRFSGGQAVPVLNFQTGLSYAPVNCSPWLRFSLGYQVEQWWGVGNLHGNSANLTTQGLFFRGEFRF